MTQTRCHRCDRLLFECNERYLVSIRVSPDEISADSLPPSPGEPSVCGLDTLHGGPGQQPPDEDQDAMAFVVCRRCRVQWSANPMGLTQRPTQPVTYLH